MLKNRFSRRSFFRHASIGALGAALPQLSWTRTVYGQAQAPKRVVLMFAGNGAPEEYFFPLGPSSTTSVFPLINEPLVPLRDQIQIISGIHTFVPGSDQNSGGHGAPHRMFNARVFGERHDTIDTALGRLWGDHTPFENLLLGTMMDSGEDRALTTRAGATLYYERSPMRAFDAMFRAGTSVDTTDYDRRKKVIDIAREQVRRFRSQLGNIERQKLDEHLTAIDRVDSLLQPPGGGGGACDNPAFNTDGFNGDVNNSENFDAVTTRHIQLIALAFQCDMTRVVNFGLVGDQGEPNIPSLMSYGYHGGSVHSDSRERYAQYRRFFTTKLVELMNALAATPDVDGGNVLDNTLIVFTSNMGDGSVHGNTREYLNVPTILAGGRNLRNKVGHYTNLGYNAENPTQFRGDPATRRYIQGTLLDSVAMMAGVDIDAPTWSKYGRGLQPISEIMT